MLEVGAETTQSALASCSENPDDIIEDRVFTLRSGGASAYGCYVKLLWAPAAGRSIAATATPAIQAIVPSQK